MDFGPQWCLELGRGLEFGRSLISVVYRQFVQKKTLESWLSQQPYWFILCPPFKKSLEKCLLYHALVSLWVTDFQTSTQYLKRIFKSEVWWLEDTYVCPPCCRIFFFSLIKIPRSRFHRSLLSLNTNLNLYLRLFLGIWVWGFSSRAVVLWFE